MITYRDWRQRLPLIALMLAAIAALVATTAGAAGQERLRGAKSWGYQLQYLDIKVLAASPYDVLVVDYSRDSSDEQRLTPAELQTLQRKPDGGRRQVLAYLSIGEAEDYRYYWHWTWGGSWPTAPVGWFMAPCFLGPANRQWSGNYAVRYWDEGWQKILLGRGGYLDRIIEAGFDGVYLDKVDSSIEKVAGRRASAQDDMRTLVRRIAEHGRRARPGFAVVPQNGEELLTDAAYRRIIDGLGKEDLLYGEEREKSANPAESVAQRMSLLKLLLDEGKPVLAVEYLDDAATIAAARKRLTELGVIAHFAGRELDYLRVGDLPPQGRTPSSGRRRSWLPWPFR